MKHNVDLTESEIFSRVLFSQAENRISKFMRSSLKGIFPWNPHWATDFDESFGEQREKIIATGNREERRMVSEFRKMDSPNYCDCCGRQMNLKPWDIENGICHKCAKTVKHLDEDKCLWRKVKPDFGELVLRRIDE